MTEYERGWQAASKRWETKVERWLTALRFYARPDHYPRQLTGEGGFRSPVLIDGGHQAREAIEGK